METSDSLGDELHSLLGAPQRPRFNFDNTYAALPDRFYARVSPRAVAHPRLLKLNVELASSLNLDPAALQSPEGVAVLAGNQAPDGSALLAQAYAGHQFGQFVPQLGDGRANLIGEVVGLDGKRYDIQLKGSGPTPYSRRGDGRAALGPVLREYVVSEAMAALGIPTTRALAAVATGEQVVRETILPGAVLTRVAASHLRVGTFEYFAARRDIEGLRILADYAIARHYPGEVANGRSYSSFLEAVVGRQARLVAQWMLVGFIHGVMNTDNTSISGETIDYGPCAFMEEFSPDAVFSSIDMQGRYRFQNQPHAMHWNLTRLAEALLPLLESETGGEQAAIDAAYAALGNFGTQFETAYLDGMRLKLGLSEKRDGDAALAEDLLRRMAANRADFTLTFRRLCDAATGKEGDEPMRALFANPTEFDEWASRWRERLGAEGAPAEEVAARMRMANPIFIPRNHLVEQMISAAVEKHDMGPFEELLRVVTRPYRDMPDREHYATPAQPEERVTATFCGT